MVVKELVRGMMMALLLLFCQASFSISYLLYIGRIQILHEHDKIEFGTDTPSITQQWLNDILAAYTAAVTRVSMRFTS